MSRTFRRDADQVQIFFEESLRLVPRAKSGMYLKDLYAVYKRWFQEQFVTGLPLGRNTFSALFEHYCRVPRSERNDTIVFYRGIVPIVPLQMRERSKHRHPKLSPQEKMRRQEQYREALSLRLTKKLERMKRDELKQQVIVQVAQEKKLVPRSRFLRNLLK